MRLLSTDLQVKLHDHVSAGADDWQPIPEDNSGNNLPSGSAGGARFIDRFSNLMGNLMDGHREFLDVVPPSPAPEPVIIDDPVPDVQVGAADGAGGWLFGGLVGAIFLYLIFS